MLLFDSINSILSHLQRPLPDSLLGTFDSTLTTKLELGSLSPVLLLLDLRLHGLLCGLRCRSLHLLFQNLEGPDHIPKDLTQAFSLLARDHGARAWMWCAEPRPQGAASLVLSTYQPSSSGPHRAPCSHHSQGPSLELLKSLLSLHQSPEHQMGLHSPLGLPAEGRQREQGSDKDRQLCSSW